MRAGSLTLVALLVACSSSLTLGDRSFARGEYLAAADAYRQAHQDEADAILFRTALLCTTRESPMYDPDRARELLQTLRDRYGRGVYGTAAAHALQWLDERAGLQAQLTALDDKLAVQAAACGRTTSADRQQLAARQSAITGLQDEKQKLTAQLKALRDGQSGLQGLRDENQHLKAEIEELKRIDLRR